MEANVGAAATTSEPGSGELLLRMLRLSGWLILTRRRQPAELRAVCRLPSGEHLRVTATGPTVPDAAFALFERACTARSQARAAASQAPLAAPVFRRS